MSRIEKVWGTVFGTAVVKRKESADQDNLPRQQDQERKREPDEERQTPVSRQALDKAVADLKASSNFDQTGMRVEMIEAGGDVVVRLVQVNGMIVKTMSAEEFLRLRDSSSADQRPRGKILDQKF